MGKESPYFGAPGFSPREKNILRFQNLINRAGRVWLDWRYRDRLHLGSNCRIDPFSFMIAGTGSVIMDDDCVVDRGLHKLMFHLEAESTVKIGKSVWWQTFDDNTVFSTKAGASIDVGDGCWFSGGIFGASKSIKVGSHTLIGWGCMVLDSNMHRMDNDDDPVTPEPVEIGSHVWMPSWVTVTRGVKIGDHCVIGSGSYVNSDIPSNSFAAGRPAKVIKKISNRDEVE